MTIRKTTQIQQARNIIEAVDFVLDNDPKIVETRCLITTTMIKHFLDKTKIKYKSWYGTTRWFSENMIIAINKKEDIFNSPDPEALAKRGIRYIEVTANSNMTATELGGHAALKVKADGHFYLLDPTAFQFNRTIEKNGYICNAPRFFMQPITKQQFYSKEVIEFFHKEPLNAGHYEEIPLNSIANMKTLNRKTDLDYNRYPHIVRAIADRINQPQ